MLHNCLNLIIDKKRLHKKAANYLHIQFEENGLATEVYKSANKVSFHRKRYQL